MIPYTVKAVMQLLRADGSVATNKKLMREVGPIEAILYGELFSRCAYFEERGMLTKDGFFYNTVEDMQKDTGLTRKLQKPAIDKLVNMGLIEMEIRGIPAKGISPMIIWRICFIYSTGKRKQEEKRSSGRLAALS